MAPTVSILRPHLLAGALRFVQAASKLDGVMRIDLVGSLTTTKANPKDVDLLVTVADDCDLTRLAALGRTLRGHCLQRSRGADVFLCSPAGAYLGRACVWRICQFGVRERCDALHCGQRPYLHDDLADLTLPSKLIEQPPITLWPVISAIVSVPDDVEAVLLGPLRAAAGDAIGGETASN